MSKGVRSGKQVRQIGEELWKSDVIKINSELFTLTYGSIVAQLCRENDYDYAKVNDILYEMGYNIGVRLIEEFLCKSRLERCTNLKETSEIITNIGFKMFLNIVPQITYWSSDGRTFQITLPENPLADFVELPDDFDDVEGFDDVESVTNGIGDIDFNKKHRGNARKELWYSNILCGVLKGSLEMVQLDCQVWFVNDTLRGDETTDIKVKLNQVLKDEIPDGDE